MIDCRQWSKWHSRFGAGAALWSETVMREKSTFCRPIVIVSGAVSSHWSQSEFDFCCHTRKSWHQSSLGRARFPSISRRFRATSYNRVIVALCIVLCTIALLWGFARLWPHRSAIVACVSRFALVTQTENQTVRFL